MTGNTSTVRGIAKTLGGQWTKFVIQILGTAILARILSPGDYGTMAMIMAVIGVGTLFADFGLSLASLRSPNMPEQERSNLLWFNLAIGGFIAGTVVLCSQIIAGFYKRPELSFLIAFLAITFVLQAGTGQFRAQAAGRQQFGRIVIVDVLSQLFATAVAVVLALRGYGYWALAFQQILIVAFQLAGLIIVSRWVPMLPRNVRGMQRHVSFGAKASGNQFINYISSNVDTILLGRIWGAFVLGIYSQGYLLYKMPIQQIAAPLTHVVVPALARATSEKFESHVMRLQAALAYLIGGVFMVLASVSSEFVRFFLGPGWEGVAPVFSILAVGGMFQVLGYVYYWVFIVKDLAGRQLVVGGMARVAMVIGIIYCVQWGSTGVAWAVTAGLAFNWLLLTVIVVPLSGIKRRTFFASVGKPVVSLAVGFLAVKGIQHLLGGAVDGLTLILVSGGLWVIIFFLGAVVWKGLRQDMLEIASAMRILIRRGEAV